MKMNKNQLGLALGSLSASMHLLWVLAVAAGMGQVLADMWHSTHFLSDKHIVEAFSFGTALFGLVGAFIAGYVTGWIFGLLANYFNK